MDTKERIKQEKKLEKKIKKQKAELSELKKNHARVRRVTKLILLFPEEAHRLETLAKLWRRSASQVIRDLINEKFEKSS